jgi:hypothetical protein|nr:MAG TPA: Protein of unknown function (DUF3164) [Caudoviricetes sp.]
MEQVQMTAEERKEYEAFRAEKQKKEAEAARKAAREQYAAMVDEEVAAAVVELQGLSNIIRTAKERVYANFHTVLSMKAEVIGTPKDTQRSHTFTTSDSQYRLTLGVNTIDGYRDTVEDGIDMVRSYIESLAKDKTTQALVSAVLRLLARDATGQIKASRVLQLRKMAEEVGDGRFLEGVRIIEEAYQPTETKQYIRAEFRDEQGAWKIVPLSVTEV